MFDMVVSFVVIDCFMLCLSCTASANVESGHEMLNNLKTLRDWPTMAGWNVLPIIQSFWRNVSFECELVTRLRESNYYNIAVNALNVWHATCCVRSPA